MRVLAFADLHYCVSWPLLTLEDFELAGDRICQYAIEVQPDVVLFIGDRFRARQPKDHIRALADRQFRALADILAKHRGVVVVVVGNHDRYSESVDSGHTYSTFRVFHDVVPNISIITEPGTYPFSQGPTPWVLHALPSGYQYDASKYTVQGPEWGPNVFAFHGLVRGGCFDAKGLVEIEEGVISLADLDDSRWDVVLGGDVHIPQKFRLTRTVGGYVGATLRLTEADADDWRGFLDVQLHNAHGREVEITRVDGGGPWFTAVSLSPDPSTWPNPSPYVGAIVIATIKGKALDLRGITDARVRQHFTGARHVRVHRRFEHEAPALVPDITAATSPLDDAVAYIRSVTSGFEEARLVTKARTALGAEPVRRGGLF